ncbi:TraR/DksA C4-type zinc finger protein [Candidatus Uhrbacteria bacterium]|nr:TraR/DksA C4-type zinc finger protein [Candidatus Uhrbacteria bacterium]
MAERRQVVVDHLRRSRDHEAPERASVDDMPVTAIDPVELQRTTRMSRERRILEERLTQLERGEPILCEGCEEPIPAQRLAAVPTAKRCIACQENVERTDPRIHIAALV